MLIPVSSADDERLSDYTRLTDVALRRKLETENGLYMAESTKVIVRAIDAGHRPRSVLADERWLDELAPALEEAGGDAHGGDIPVYVCDEAALQSITGFHLHRGAIAAMNRPRLRPARDLLASLVEGSRRVVVLEGIVDHTNVGAIFRSAAALGVDAMLVAANCADPLYRRSVRVSMGTVFQVPWTRIEGWPASMSLLSEFGYTTAALALAEDAIALADFAGQPCCLEPDSKVALILGAEGDGLAPQTIARADYSVIIPMAGGVDSLNVAAASAVACWELRRR
ncbi:MAG: RNA methyltransferase [Actinomycetaceae bacterium]|nr:RNA methyltransferase [Actinomycetaceae bacterium]